MATQSVRTENFPSQDSDSIAKFDQHKDAQFLDKSRLVTQALEIKAKAVYRRIFENPCVGGSIPPRATKNHYSSYMELFLFNSHAGHMVYTIYRAHGLHILSRFILRHREAPPAVKTVKYVSGMKC